jgi:hypothetical protein
MLFLLLYPLTYFILIKQIIFSYTKIRLQKTLYSTRSCVNWAFFGTRGPLNPRFTRVLNWPTHAKKVPIYTQTR